MEITAISILHLNSAEVIKKWPKLLSLFELLLFYLVSSQQKAVPIPVVLPMSYGIICVEGKGKCPLLSAESDSLCFSWSC